MPSNSGYTYIIAVKPRGISNSIVQEHVVCTGSKVLSYGAVVSFVLASTIINRCHQLLIVYGVMSSYPHTLVSYIVYHCVRNGEERLFINMTP